MFAGAFSDALEPCCSRFDSVWLSCSALPRLRIRSLPAAHYEFHSKALFTKAYNRHMGKVFKVQKLYGYLQAAGHLSLHMCVNILTI